MQKYFVKNHYNFQLRWQYSLVEPRLVVKLSGHQHWILYQMMCLEDLLAAITRVMTVTLHLLGYPILKGNTQQEVDEEIGVDDQVTNNRHKRQCFLEVGKTWREMHWVLASNVSFLQLYPLGRLMLRQMPSALHLWNRYQMSPVSCSFLLLMPSVWRKIERYGCQGKMMQFTWSG